MGTIKYLMRNLYVIFEEEVLPYTCNYASSLILGRALYRIMIYRLYRYFSYMIHIICDNVMSLCYNPCLQNVSAPNVRQTFFENVCQIPIENVWQRVATFGKCLSNL